MDNLASEFQALSRAYLQLTEDLGTADDPHSGDYVQRLLQTRDRLSRIAQLNARVLELAEQWKHARGGLDPESRERIGGLADAARQQAVRLNELCAAHARKLESMKETLGKELVELNKGNRYLDCVKPARANYPKFIDSHC